MIISPAYAIARHIDSEWLNIFGSSKPNKVQISTQQIPDNQKFPDAVVLTDTGGTAYSDRLNTDSVNFQLFVRNSKAGPARTQMAELSNYLNSNCFEVRLDDNGSISTDPNDDYIQFQVITPTSLPVYVGLDDKKLRIWTANFTALACQSADRNRF